MKSDTLAEKKSKKQNDTRLEAHKTNKWSFYGSLKTAIDQGTVKHFVNLVSLYTFKADLFPTVDSCRHATSLKKHANCSGSKSQ